MTEQSSTNIASAPAEARRIRRCIIASGVLCVGGAALGLVGQFGWITRDASLYSLVPNQPPMMPNTALSLTLAGLTGALLGRAPRARTTRVLQLFSALVLLAMAVLTLAQYALHVDLGIDQLLMPGQHGTYPGRMSPLTALAIGLLGFAILCFDARRDALLRPSELALLATAVLGLVGLTGQSLGTRMMYGLPRAPMVGMAVQSTLAILLLSIGMLLARPTAGMMAVANSEAPGGVLLRRIVPISVVLPMLLGFAITRLFEIMAVTQFPLVVASVAITITMLGLGVLLVTARLLNRTDAALEASRRRTRDLIALASDGVFVADIDGHFTEVNEAGARLLGMTQGEIVGRSFRDFIRPEDRDRLTAEWQTLIHGGVQISEWLVRHQSGTYIPVEVSDKFLPDGRWQAFVRDIRERKAAEEEVRRSKARVEGIISIAGDAIVSLDDSLRITIFNHAAEQMFGWTAQDVIGRSVDILVPDRLRKPYLSYARRFAADTAPARRVGALEAPIYGLRKDGTEFMAEAAISKLDIGSERTFTLVARDVTSERRRSEQERLLAAIGLLLTSSLERAELVAAAGRVLVMRFADVCVVELAQESDGQPKADAAVVQRDPTKAGLARALAHLQLQRWRPRTDGGTTDSTRSVLLSPLTPELLEEIARTEKQRRHLHELAPASLIAVPLRARGALLGTVTLASTDHRRRYDLVDARFAEEIGIRLALAIDNARLFETARAAVTARDEVLRVVAHDLRNPLNLILMRASLLLEEGFGGEDERRQSAEAIVAAARRMNRLIRDLLDVSRYEAGGLTVEHGAVPARDVVHDAVVSQQTFAAGSALEIREEVPEKLPDIDGDRDRILQIFENLIGNAVNFTPRGGRIVAGAAPRSHEVLFWVKDTGAGIPTEDLQHVFDRYWQGRKVKGDGAGLGLMIVKALVEAHHGRVWVRSAPGHGTTFYFTIPQAENGAGPRVQG